MAKIFRGGKKLFSLKDHSRENLKAEFWNELDLILCLSTTETGEEKKVSIPENRHKQKLDYVEIEWAIYVHCQVNRSVLREK